jgi:MFS family permease
MADEAIEQPGALSQAAARTTSDRASPYAYYALALLVLAAFFNYVDRAIVSIVGQRIKADMRLTDAELGIILGTAYGVFYGVVGIALGRISDAVPRTRLMGAGMALWSGMTALAGVATSFVGLASARLGVGIGEATANPCSHSLLSDYFPARNRATVMATYVAGGHLGTAFSLAAGGLILQHWSTMCLSLPTGACHIADWRVVFLLVGAPGLIVAGLIALLREPARPLKAEKRGVAGLVAHELSAATPPLTLFSLMRTEGPAGVVKNVLFAAGLALAAVALSATVGDWPQWAASAVGVYSITTWGRVLSRRDPPLHRLTFGCPTFMMVAAGGALSACVFGAVGAWAPAYVIRTLHAGPAQTGISLGVISALCAILSAVVGGFITDLWKRRDPRAPVWMILFSVAAPLPALVLMLRARDLAAFLPAYAAFVLLAMTWSGGAAALVQDLILPRMRGAASAAFSLIIIVVSFGIGPYMAGKISTLTGSLATGLLSMTILAPVAATLLILAARRMPGETPHARLALARAAGEPG